jgi:hypothetical protein
LSRPAALARFRGTGLPSDAAEAISAVALVVDAAAGLIGRPPLPVRDIAQPVPAGSP